MHIALDLGVDMREIKAAPNLFFISDEGLAAKQVLKDVCKTVSSQVCNSDFEKCDVDDWVSQIMTFIRNTETSSFSDLFVE